MARIKNYKFRTCLLSSLLLLCLLIQTSNGAKAIVKEDGGEADTAHEVVEHQHAQDGQVTHQAVPIVEKEKDYEDLHKHDEDDDDEGDNETEERRGHRFHLLRTSHHKTLKDKLHEVDFVLVIFLGCCIVLGLVFYYMLFVMTKYKKRYQERRREKLLDKMKKQRESGGFESPRPPEARSGPLPSSLGGYGGNSKTVYANNKKEGDVEMGGEGGQVVILHKNSSDKLPKKVTF